MAPKQASQAREVLERGAKSESKTPGNYLTASRYGKSQEPTPTRAAPKKATENESLSIAAAVAEGKKISVRKKAVAGLASRGKPASKAGGGPPKKRVKDKGTAVDSLTEEDGEEEEKEEEGPVAPRNRLGSVGQNIYQNKPNYFKRLLTQKAKQDRLAAAAADEPQNSDDDDDDDDAPEPARHPPKRPTKPKPQAAPKNPAANRKTTKSPAIKNGNIQKPVRDRANDTRSNHHPMTHKDRGYESVPEDSDYEEGKRETIHKLRSTIDRHAQWCPFVKLNKKIHYLYRKVRDSQVAVGGNDKGDAKKEAVEINDEDDGEKNETDEDDEDDEKNEHVEDHETPEDDGVDEESVVKRAAKSKQELRDMMAEWKEILDESEPETAPSNTATTGSTAAMRPPPRKTPTKTGAAGSTATEEPAPEKTSSKKKIPAKAAKAKAKAEAKAAAAADNRSDSDSEDITVARPRGEDTEQSDHEFETRQSQSGVDERLEHLPDAPVEEARKAHEKSLKPHPETGNLKPMPQGSASGKKRKASDVETAAAQQKGKGKGKKPRLEADEELLME